MSVQVNLANPTQTFDTSKDEIVIRNYVAGIIGGRSLDVTGYTEPTIKAGHVIIRDTEANVYKPMPVSGEVYGSLPEGHEYVGVLRGTILTSKPLAAIMYSGEVNDVAAPYPFDNIKSALKEAIPTLVFMHD